MAKTPHQFEQLLGKLGHDERAVIEIFLERLAMGREHYGELKAMVDQRDFHAEALDEVLDLAVYLCIAVLRLGAEHKPMFNGENR